MKIDQKQYRGLKTTPLADLAVELINALDKARAAGVSRDACAKIVQQVLTHKSYFARVSE